MAIYNNKRFRLGSLAVFLLFSSLLFYRVAFLDGRFKGSTDPQAWQGAPLKAGESWMNIFQSNRKIGFSRRILETVKHGYRIHEETVMNIDIMGMKQEIRVRSVSTTDMDFAVRTFDFEIASGSFNFALTGEIQGSVLHVKSRDRQGRGGKTIGASPALSGEDHETYSGDSPSLSGPDHGKSLKIPLENRPYLTSGIIQAVVASGLEQGQEMILFIFDPSTLGQAPATIKVQGVENIMVNGELVQTRKVSLRFKGTRQYAWLNQEGEVLREKGMLGIILEKTDRQGALDGVPLGVSEDLTQLVSVASNRELENPEKLTRLKVRIRQIDDLIEQGHFSLNQGRQTWQDGVLLIEKESVKHIEQISRKLDQKAFTEALQGIDARFTAPDAFIQSRHPRIRNIAERIVGVNDDPLEKVKKLVAWIQTNIRRQPVLSLPNALSTLENGMGDCNEHAALLAAFCRAVGLPAKIEAGLVYLNGRFYYHAWNLVFVGSWITVDALFNQIPSDVTHITFSSGSQEVQLNLMGMMGKVELEIID